MSERERSLNHDDRLKSLLAFEALVDRDVDAGLAIIGALDTPQRVQNAILLLVQSNRFQDAVSIVQDKEIHCKWVDLAVYAHVATARSSEAISLISKAVDACEPWVPMRCRIAFAEAAFAEVAEASGISSPSIDVSPEETALLESVVEVLSPIVQQVRLFETVDGSFQQFAVEYMAKAYGLLGQLSQLADLVKPLQRCKPVPLVLGQLTLEKICPPPPGLSGRLRVEHPKDFSAKLLAALLDREFYTDRKAALDSLINLKAEAREAGVDAILQVCQALFETASPIDSSAVRRAQDAVDSLLGPENKFKQFFDTVHKLHEERFAEAIQILESERREGDPVWWQILAQAHEATGNLEEAAKAWDKACKILPHRMMLNHFAGLSIRQRSFADAARALETALSGAPEDAGLLRQLALAYTRLQQWPDAVKVFTKLITLEPDVDEHRINLAISHARSGASEQALAALEPFRNTSTPNLDAIGIRCELLNGLGRSTDAFEALKDVAEQFWSNHRFLVLYMTTAYSAGADAEGHRAFEEILIMQKNGALDEPVLHPISIDELVSFGDERRHQRDSLMAEVTRGKLPWLFAESLLGNAAWRTWHSRTQQLKWLPDDITSRAEFGVYATNQLTVLANHDDRRRLTQIESSPPGETVVVDMSALITLHRLGRLSAALDYFGKIILPGSYGDILVKEARSLAPHQPSQEEELRRLRSAAERKTLQIVDRHDSMSPYVDEHTDDMASHIFRLADVRRVMELGQHLTSEQIAQFEKVCHKPGRDDVGTLQTSQVVFDLFTIRTLASYEWFDQALSSQDWAITRSDYEAAIGELHSHERNREVHEWHRTLWEEINRLKDDKTIEFRWTDEIRRFHGQEDAEIGDPPPYFDAAVLAKELRHSLLADDRVCQTTVLNSRPDCIHASFGTTHLLGALMAGGALTLDEACDDIMCLIKWRYRFLVVTPDMLGVLAKRSLSVLPGPELREVAVYVQDSMRDPGLFCGLETSDPPMPIGFRYFMDWKDVCCDFIASIWADSEFEDDQRTVVTRWVIEELMPSIPKGLLYSPVGKRLGAMTPVAFLQAAMVKFTMVAPLDRANRGLRLVAELLSITDDEYISVAAEVADVRHD